MVQVSHSYLATGKTIALTRRTFVGKVSSLLFNTLSRCHNFPSKEQVSFIFVAAVTVCSDFGAQENKTCHCFHFSPIYLPWSDGTGYHDLNVLNVEFYVNFFTLLFHPHQEILVPLYFLSLEWYHLHIWGCWYFSWQSWFQLLLHPAQHSKHAYRFLRRQIRWSGITISLRIFHSLLWSTKSKALA